MKKFILLLSVLISSFSYQIAHAQISADRIKLELANKEWKIVQYEVFEIPEEPSPEQINDKITLNTDMTFVIIENGISYKGKWTVQSPQIICKTEDKTWAKTYKVMAIDSKKATIEYKDPDLIKTLYYLETE
jgi:hypothetical protein